MTEPVPPEMSVDDEDERNRRRHPRVPLPILVQYRAGALDELHTEYALNLSESGLLLADRIDQPVGATVLVQVTTRDGAHILSGEGRVARNEARGSAIELVGFTEEARAILKRVVDQSLNAHGEKQVGPATRRRRRSRN